MRILAFLLLLQTLSILSFAQVNRLPSNKSCSQVEVTMMELHDLESFTKMAPWVVVNTQREGNALDRLNRFLGSKAISNSYYDGLNYDQKRKLFFGNIENLKQHYTNLINRNCK